MSRLVELKDQSPLLVKPESLHNGVCAVCRCGLSGNWPFCDGTHKSTIGEEPGKLYRYEREMPQGPVRRLELAREGQGAGPAGKEEGHAGAERPPRPEPQPPAARKLLSDEEGPARGAHDPRT